MVPMRDSEFAEAAHEPPLFGDPEIVGTPSHQLFGHPLPLGGGEGWGEGAAGKFKGAMRDKSSGWSSHEPGGTSNIEHPTPNIEWQRESFTSAFGVRCWTFDVFLRFRGINARIFISGKSPGLLCGGSHFGAWLLLVRRCSGTCRNCFADRRDCSYRVRLDACAGARLDQGRQNRRRRESHQNQSRQCREGR